MIELSLIIPTYNEAKNLPLLIPEILEKIDKNKIDLEFIIVDDNSPDGTGILAEELKKQYPIQVIHRAGKLGLGSAVRAGFDASKRPYSGVMDADLSHDPKILNDLILDLNTYDLAIGSRFENSSTVENWQKWRKTLSQTGVFLSKLLTKTNDPLSGYFFLRREVIQNTRLTTTGYKILLEILVKGHYQKIKERPYNFRQRRYSASKLNYQEYLLFVGQLIWYAIYKLTKPKKI